MAAYIEVCPRDFQENESGMLLTMPVPVSPSTAGGAATPKSESAPDELPHVLEANSITGFIASHKIMLGIVLAVVVIIIIVVLIYNFVYGETKKVLSLSTNPIDEATSSELEAFLLTAKTLPQLNITPPAVQPIIPPPPAAAVVDETVVVPSVAIDITPPITVTPIVPTSYVIIDVLPEAPSAPLQNIVEEIINDDHYMVE